MRNLHVVRRMDGELGGVTTAVREIATAVARAGHDVVVATTIHSRTTKNAPRPVREVSAGGYELLSFGRATQGQAFDLSMPLALWLWRNAEKFDVIDVHGIWDFPAFSAARVAARRGVPYLVSPHGSLDPFDLQKHNSAKRLLGPLGVRRTLQCAAGICFTTEREADLAVTYGATVDRVVIGIPLLTSAVGSNAVAPPTSSEFNVLFMGRIDYKKGLRELVDAVKILAGQDVPVRLVLAGAATTPWGQSFLDELRADRSAPVIILGHVEGESKQALLADAHAFVLVSQNENYALSLVEAAAAGLPLVVSPDVYVSQQLETAGAALVVALNPREIAQALTRLAADSALRRSMARAARGLMGTLYDYDELCRRQVETRVALR